MAIYQTSKKTKDGRTWYFSVHYKDLQGKDKKYNSKLFATKKEAAEAQANYQFLSKNTGSKLTIKELELAYLDFQKNKVKISTYNNYHKYTENLKSIENIKVENFNINQFNLWKKEIDNKNYSTNYKNHQYKFLIAIFNYAEKYYEINLTTIKNKMSGFSDPNELKKEMLFFTYDEFKLFINEITELKYKTYFETLYYCGLRKGEANVLNWNDIDFDNHTISITKNLTLKLKGLEYVILPPKTKNSIRLLPMPKILENDLKELKKEYSKYSNFSNKWFVYGGIAPLKDTTIANKKNIACKNAKIKEIRIHDFRHSCASLLINNGASLPLVSKYLGHSNITTTLNTYTHMFKNELQDIVDSLNKLI